MSPSMPVPTESGDRPTTEAVEPPGVAASINTDIPPPPAVPVADPSVVDASRFDLPESAEVDSGPYRDIRPDDDPFVDAEDLDDTPVAWGVSEGVIPRDDLIVVTTAIGSCDELVGGYAYWNGRAAVVVLFGGLSTGWFARCNDDIVYLRLSLYVPGAIAGAPIESVGGTVQGTPPILPSGSLLPELLLLPGQLPFYAA